ncbi:MAG: PucR family transcriptional regulator [Clostridium sp.]|nr:PucR family transcriptional regulator [Clostridium sp.]
MDIKQALELPSLATAKVIAGNNGLGRKVTGIMVLEAADIESWGREGEIILTSYFALKDLDEEEIGNFFVKLHEIGISALVIKLDRLLTDIPESAVTLCNQYAIPLIQLGKEVKYEAVVLQILSPIIDQNVTLLNRHYQVHNQLTRLALKEPSVHTILNELKKMISCNVTLVNKTKHTEIGTSFYYDQYQILESTPIPSTQFMNFRYDSNTVRYLRVNTDSVFRAISVHVPNLEQEDCDLVIHVKNRDISNDDFMVIETVVSFLQMELLKQYSVSQNLFHLNNNLVNDLLNGRIYTREKVDDLLRQIHMDRAPHYQIMMIRLTPEDEALLKNPDWASGLFRYLRDALKQRWFNIAFLEKQDRITFLNNYSRDEELFTRELAAELLQSMAAQPSLPRFHSQTAISTTGGAGDIPRLNQEVLDIQKVQHLFHRPGTIYTYDDLGIYKLFLSTDNLDHLEHFVPPAFLRFRREFPELMETLSCFLDHNQSFSETAAAMYLHPKTIRYRVSQIAGKLPFDFGDPEMILEAQIASRLFRLME